VRAAGIDLVRLAYARAVGAEPPTVDSFRDDIGLWFPLDDFRAMRQYRADGELTTRAWVRTLLHPQVRPELDWADPLPSMSTLAGRTARLARRGTRRARGMPRAVESPLGARVAST
jgi:hypothetical protein